MNERSDETTADHVALRDGLAVEAPDRDDDTGALAPDDPRPVGDMLADARRARGWTLSHVTEALRIQEDYLNAIETMDPRGLPEAAFVGGYVRSYAGLLGLDAAAVAARFKREIATGGGLRLEPPPPPAPIAVPLRPVFAIGVALALVGAVWLGWPRSANVIDMAPPVPEGLKAWVASDPSAARRATAVEAPQFSVRARVPTRATIRGADGRVLFQGRLDAGASVALPDAAGVEVDAENAAALELLRDGESLERLGSSNLPVSAWSLDVARVRALARDAASEAPAEINDGLPSPG